MRFKMEQAKEERLLFDEVRDLAGLAKGYGFSAGYGGNKQMVKKMMKQPVVAYAVGWKSGIVFARDGYKNLRAFTMSCDEPISGYGQMIYAAPLSKALKIFNSSNLFKFKKEYEKVEVQNMGHITFEGLYRADATYYLKSFNNNKIKFINDYGAAVSIKGIVSELKSKDKITQNTLPKTVFTMLKKMRVIEEI